MSYTPQSGTIPAKALAALALVYPDPLHEGDLLSDIEQPEFDELPNVMTLAVTMGYVVRELKPGGWYWRATAEGVASQAEQQDAANKPALSPMQRMTQAAARKPPVAVANPEKEQPRAKVQEAPPPAEPASAAPPAPCEPKRPDIQSILSAEDQAALDAIPALAEMRTENQGVAAAIDLEQLDVAALCADLQRPDRVLALHREHFDCALSAGGRLRIEKGVTTQVLTVEETRQLLRYLDRIRPEEETV